MMPVDCSVLCAHTIPASRIYREDREVIMRQLEERYLERLSQLYPTIAKASTEIINLQAILESAKGHRAFSDGHSWGI